MFLNQKIEFWGVKGVHHLDLKLSEKIMNVLIGANGVGKTKALESLYTLLHRSFLLLQCKCCKVVGVKSQCCSSGI